MLGRFASLAQEGVLALADWKIGEGVDVHFGRSSVRGSGSGGVGRDGVGVEERLAAGEQVGGGAWDLKGIRIFREIWLEDHSPLILVPFDSSLLFELETT